MMKTINKIYLMVIILTTLAHSQDVTIMVSDTSFSGYTEDIIVRISMSNPNNTVGGVQFDVSVEPSMVMLSDVTPSGIGAGFSADHSSFNNGNSRVVFYNS